MADGNYSYCGKHFVMQLSVKLLCWAPKTNIILYINYTPIIKKVHNCFCTLQCSLFRQLPEVQLYPQQTQIHLANSTFIYFFFYQFKESLNSFSFQHHQNSLLSRPNPQLLYGDACFQCGNMEIHFTVLLLPSVDRVIGYLSFFTLQCPLLRKQLPNYECTLINTRLGTNMRFIQDENSDNQSYI